MSNVADSPKHFIVLDAVSRGMNEVGKIAKVTKMDKAEVELVVNDLSSQRLLTAGEKRGLLGKKTAGRDNRDWQEPLSGQEKGVGGKGRRAARDVP